MKHIIRLWNVQNLPAAVLRALLMAVLLYVILLAVIWGISCIPGLSTAIRNAAGNLGIETAQLLEFIAIVVAAVFVAVQLWLSNRRAEAAEATAKASSRSAAANAKSARAAADTALFTGRSMLASRFKDAVDAIETGSEVSKVGGVQMLKAIAEDYVEYRSPVSEVLRAHIQQR